MKKLIALAFLCFGGSTYAQFKLPAKLTGNRTEKTPDRKAVPSIKTDIQKVARDLYEGFNNVKGDTIGYSNSVITFKSKIVPVGATECIVTQHPYPNSYSWQAVMFASDDFDEAVAKYKNYYKQLYGSMITFYDNTSYKLTGEYDLPDEGRSFAASMLKLDEPGEKLKAFKIEIGLNYSFPEWSVSILIYEKMADEDIRPLSDIRVF